MVTLILSPPMLGLNTINAVLDVGDERIVSRVT